MNRSRRISLEGILSVTSAAVREIGVVHPCGSCTACCARDRRRARLVLTEDHVALEGLRSFAGNLRDGESVRISVEASGLTRAAIILFALPVAVLLGGALIGERIAADAGSIIMGYSALLLAGGVALRFAPRMVGWTRLWVEPSDPLACPRGLNDR